MRARVLMAAGLLAAASACSKPPAETGLGQDDKLASDLDLALTQAQSSDRVAVASALEAPRPQPPVQKPPKRPTKAPPQDNVLVAEPEPEKQVAPVPEPSGDPGFTLSPMPGRPAESVLGGETAAATGPGAGSNGGTEDGWRTGRTVEGPSSGPEPTVVIIRGGIGTGGVSGRDPCAIHFPGRGGLNGPLGPMGGVFNPNGGVNIGGVIPIAGGTREGGDVLINDRMPRGGSVSGPNIPTQRPAGNTAPRGRTGGGMSRRGIR